ncbi:PelD GGDEF domain-containing protein [Thermovibrio sp.]
MVEVISKALRSQNRWIILFEVLLATLIFIDIGLFLNQKDPLFTSYTVNPFIIFLLVITLYYGLEAGLLALLLEVVSMVLLYKGWNVKFLLWSLLNVLIAGEFHFFWTKKIRVAEEENHYFKDKLRRQTSDLILLKLSHDQLEKHYMVKPISIRMVVEEIKEKLKKRKDREEMFEKLRELLTYGFYVQEAALYLKEEEGYKLATSVGAVPFKENDPLVEKALEVKEAVFISQLRTPADTQYLAVIPIYNFADEDELLGIFLLKQIPFNYFNSDTILSLGVILHWLVNELKGADIIKEVNPVLKELLSYEFIKELAVMASLKERTGAESSLVLFSVDKLNEDFPLFLSEKIRALDLINVVELNGQKLVLVLLPLTSVASAKGFVKRIEKEFSYTSGEEGLIYRIFSVDRDSYDKVAHIFEGLKK